MFKLIRLTDKELKYVIESLDADICEGILEENEAKEKDLLMVKLNGLYKKRTKDSIDLGSHWLRDIGK